MQDIFAILDVEIYYVPMDWHKQQRLRAIEIIVYWHEKLNTKDIINAFGISRIQASKDIKHYIQAYPGNMYYSLTDRAYLKAKPFTLHLSQGSFEEYLDHSSRMKTPSEHFHVEALTSHYKPLNPAILSKVLQAIHAQKGLTLCYGSMSSPDGKTRIIYPHALIDTGFRWHVRAYCKEREAFRDFNLGRILNMPEVTKSFLQESSSQNDKAWNEQISLIIQANPALNPKQQVLIENEFAIKKKTLVVKTRACLVHYTLQRYQIDSTSLVSPPQNQMLVLNNYEQISKHLF